MGWYNMVQYGLLLSMYSRSIVLWDIGFFSGLTVKILDALLLHLQGSV